MKWATGPIVNLIHERRRNQSTTVREYRDAIQIAQSDATIKEIDLEAMDIHLPRERRLKYIQICRKDKTTHERHTD